LLGTDYLVLGANRISENPVIMEIPVTGDSGALRISPIDVAQIVPDRVITLTLVTPSVSDYQIATNHSINHLLYLSDTSLRTNGIYVGALTVTNSVLLDPQTVKVALRLGAGGLFEAYFDTSQAPIFPGPFTLHAEQTPSGLQLSGSATGTLITTGLLAKQKPTWEFSVLSSTTDPKGVLTAQFRLNIDGFTASGRTNSAVGIMILSPIN
jgi:hypothetical protein